MTPALRREWLFYVAIGAGMALSSSAFVMVSGLFAVVPVGPMLIAFVVGGLLCSVIALSIGELASMWPSSPAILTYFRMAFGMRASLLLVHLYLVFVILIAGVESYSFGLMVKEVLPGIPPMVTICLLLVAVIAVNLRGLELPRRVQILTAFGAIAIICLGAFGAVGSNPPAAWAAASDFGDMAALPAAIGFAVFIYTGFEWVTPVGLSRQAYARRVPTSMLIAIAVLLVTYGLFVLAIGTVLPRETAAASPIPHVTYFSAFLGGPGLAIAVLLTLAAIISTFNAGIMGGAQLLKAMAREGSLPGWVGTVNLETGAPIGSILLLGTIGMISALTIAALDLYLTAALIGSAIICFIYAAYLLSVERLRRTKPEQNRPFRNRLPPWVRWAVVPVMPVIGAATLFSLPELGAMPLIGFGAALVVVVALAAYSEWCLRRMSAPAAAARRRAGRPEPE